MVQFWIFRLARNIPSLDLSFSVCNMSMLIASQVGCEDRLTCEGFSTGSGMHRCLV